ncbi:MAG: hypothetical protein ACXWXO_11995 [Nocardioides sp.]
MSGPYRTGPPISSPIHSARILQCEPSTDAPGRSRVLAPDGPVPLAELLAGVDVIVNCVLQDTDAPLMFLTDEDLPTLNPGTLVVDVSCDEQMGFSWARPTSIEEPTFVVGNNIAYYAVDHSPSHLWNSATWENSEAILPSLDVVLAGPAGWDSSDTIRRAIEIRDGVVQNPAILAFQHRSEHYPHGRR